MKKTILILLLLTSGCDSAPNRAAANANLVAPQVKATQAVSLTMKVNDAVVPSGGSYDYRNTVVQYAPLVTMGDGSINQRVTYTSSAPDVATINSNGYLVASKPGSATITATSADDAKVSMKLTVNVVAATSADTLATINAAKPISDITQTGVSGNTGNGAVRPGGSGSASSAPAASATPY